MKTLNVLGSILVFSTPSMAIISCSKKIPINNLSIDEYLKKEISQGFPSAQVVISKDGNEIYNDAFGYSVKFDDNGSELPTKEYIKATKKTLYDQASNTKMYATNFALMKLMSDNLLDVDRTIKSYIPSYKGVVRDKITIRQVLTHSAGYAPEILFYSKNNLGSKTMESIGKDMPIPNPALNDDDLYSYSDNKNLYKNHLSTDMKNNFNLNHEDPSSKTKDIILNKAPLVYRAGTKSKYSDTDFMLLGILIEQIVNDAINGKKRDAEGHEVNINSKYTEALNRNHRLYPNSYPESQTKAKLDEFVEEYIYKPLGLSNTMFNPLLKNIPQNNIAATEIQGNTREGNRDFPGIRKHLIWGEVHDEKAWYTMSGVSGHAGLFSTAEDISKLQLLTLKGGKYKDKAGVTKSLIDSETIKKFTDRDPKDPTYGLGWRRVDSKGNGRWLFGQEASIDVYGHSGWTGTETLIDPAYNLTITVFTNKKHSRLMTKKQAKSMNKKWNDSMFEFDYTKIGHYGEFNTFIYQVLKNKKIIKKQEEN